MKAFRFTAMPKTADRLAKMNAILGEAVKDRDRALEAFQQALENMSEEDDDAADNLISAKRKREEAEDKHLIAESLVRAAERAHAEAVAAEMKKANATKVTAIEKLLEERIQLGANVDRLAAELADTYRAFVAKSAHAVEQITGSGLIKGEAMAEIRSFTAGPMVTESWEALKVRTKFPGFCEPLVTHNLAPNPGDSAKQIAEHITASLREALKQ